MNYGWKSVIGEFIAASSEDITEKLKEFVPNCGASQVVAWKRSINTMRAEFQKLLAKSEAASGFSIILEYELPREGGRRPDALVIGNGFIAVLEFKDNIHPKQSDIDQVKAYARDLRNYHSESHVCQIIPILVPTRGAGAYVQSGVSVCPPGSLASELAYLGQLHSSSGIIDSEMWVNGEYEPLPELIEAARMIFLHEDLPQIRKAKSAKIPETIEAAMQIVNGTAERGGRSLILITGAPGAGKTLVGLQLVHSHLFDGTSRDRRGNMQAPPAVFLSGNGPLVKVLGATLHLKTGEKAPLVKGMKPFIEYYQKRPQSTPPEKLLVFDEAQRAWSADKVAAKHKFEPKSEPELLIEIAERIPTWATVIALIGEGQEIYEGEEGGLIQWVQALKERPIWNVYVPPELADVFSGYPLIHSEPLFNLTSSMRTHEADLLHEWVHLLLSKPVESVDRLLYLAKEIQDSGYQLYLTTSLDAAKQYVKGRYADSCTKRYGLLASRYAKRLVDIGIDTNGYHYERKRQLDVVDWFTADPAEPQSNCSLQRPATEFEAQGLELDYAIVVWGEDFLFDGAQWRSEMKTNKKIRDKHQLRTNAYRVLMTRGRDGLCVYVPCDQPSIAPLYMDTYDLFLKSGFTLLESP